ncbi:GNAT family N-acetyltransferase [Psychroserpens luteolus]|uniref:GNAT family N-acetyltransferase n=1 Tax=Psychroserpens luteolus TaxID=2855840 RepID=UPI001E38D8E1|nr:GNAT family N-acetyltransferase [Psychroserpens luteolus]MCD2260571.1 GNAT family N-acetyltransferase [Psychroserpens luteolus]
MKIKTLNGITNEQLVDVFNLSFSDYSIPFHLTLEQLESKLYADHIDLNISVGAFDNDQLVGFMLHGIQTINEKKIVYNGGTGVIPTKRGHGLTTKMYEFINPILTQQHIDKVVLEVISNNIQAIKSYKRACFKKKRTLHCYKGYLNSSKCSNTLVIKELSEYNWDLMQSFWDIRPTWQNASHVLNKLKEKNHLIGAFIGDTLVGYLVYNANSKRLQQISVRKDFRRQKVGTALINYIIERFGSTLSIINVDERSTSTNAFLHAIGLKHFLSQLEMTLDLNTH